MQRVVPRRPRPATSPLSDGRFRSPNRRSKRIGPSLKPPLRRGDRNGSKTQQLDVRDIRRCISIRTTRLHIGAARIGVGLDVSRSDHHACGSAQTARRHFGRYFVTSGGLISYFVDQYRRAAGYVDGILRGEPVTVPPAVQASRN
jgi:hypothetical protein